MKKTIKLTSGPKAESIDVYADTSVWSSQAPRRKPAKKSSHAALVRRTNAMQRTGSRLVGDLLKARWEALSHEQEKQSLQSDLAQARAVTRYAEEQSEYQRQRALSLCAKLESARAERDAANAGLSTVTNLFDVLEKELLHIRRENERLNDLLARYLARDADRGLAIPQFIARWETEISAEEKDGGDVDLLQEMLNEVIALLRVDSPAPQRLDFVREFEQRCASAANAEWHVDRIEGGEAE